MALIWPSNPAAAATSPTRTSSGKTVAADGKVFFTNEAGSTLVLDATQSDYQELARNEIGEEVFASAAIAQGRFFVRTAKSLVCIGTK